MLWTIIQQMIHFSQAPSLQSNSIHFISLISTGHSNVCRGCGQAGISNNSAPDKKKQLCGRWQIVTSVYAHVLLHFCFCKIHSEIETVSAQYFFGAGFVVFCIVSSLFEVWGSFYFKTMTDSPPESLKTPQNLMGKMIICGWIFAHMRFSI